MAAYFVVAIDVGQAPASIGTLGRDAHALILLASIVDLPAIDVLLNRGRIVGESIQLIERAKATSQSLDAVVDTAGLRFVGEVEGDKGKVSTTQANGVVLAKDGGHGSVDTRRDHGVCDPHLFDTAFGLGRDLGFCGCIRAMLKDQMMSGNVKGSCGLFLPSVKCHILDLLAEPSVQDFVVMRERMRGRVGIVETDL